MTVKGDSSKQLHGPPRKSGAISGADKPISGDFDPDLRRVIDAWPTLPEAVRLDILAMVEALQVKK